MSVLIRSGNFQLVILLLHLDFQREPLFHETSGSADIVSVNVSTWDQSAACLLLHFRVE